MTKDRSATRCGIRSTRRPFFPSQQGNCRSYNGLRYYSVRSGSLACIRSQRQQSPNHMSPLSRQAKHRLCSSPDQWRVPSVLRPSPLEKPPEAKGSHKRGLNDTPGPTLDRQERNSDRGRSPSYIARCSRSCWPACLFAGCIRLSDRAERPRYSRCSFWRRPDVSKFGGLMPRSFSMTLFPAGQKCVQAFHRRTLSV